MSRPRRYAPFLPIAVVLGIPTLAWFVARSFVPSPQLVAPFLFVSPALAVMFVGWIMSLGSRKKLAKAYVPRETEEPSWEMRSIAKKFAEQTGVGDFELKVYGGESSKRDAVWSTKDELWLYSAQWGQLDPAAREFAMARGFVLLSDHRSGGPWLKLGFGGLAFAGCVLGMINLWLIIPAQAGFAVLGYMSTFAAQRKRALESDVKALELTRDLAAALDYVTSCTPEYAGPFTDRDARMKNLREAAKKLEIAA